MRRRTSSKPQYKEPKSARTQRAEQRTRNSESSSPTILDRAKPKLSPPPPPLHPKQPTRSSMDLRSRPYFPMQATRLAGPDDYRLGRLASSIPPAHPEAPSYKNHDSEHSGTRHNLFGHLRQFDDNQRFINTVRDSNVRPLGSYHREELQPPHSAQPQPTTPTEFYRSSGRRHSMISNQSVGEMGVSAGLQPRAHLMRQQLQDIQRIQTESKVILSQPRQPRSINSVRDQICGSRSQTEQINDVESVFSSDKIPIELCSHNTLSSMNNDVVLVRRNGRPQYERLSLRDTENFLESPPTSTPKDKPFINDISQTDTVPVKKEPPRKSSNDSLDGLPPRKMLPQSEYRERSQREYRDQNRQALERSPLAHTVQSEKPTPKHFDLNQPSTSKGIQGSVPGKATSDTNARAAPGTKRKAAAKRVAVRKETVSRKRQNMSPMERFMECIDRSFNDDPKDLEDYQNRVDAAINKQPGEDFQQNFQKHVYTVVRVNPWGKISYKSMLRKAILSSPQQKLMLQDIYKYLEENYTYFAERSASKKERGQWCNSVRHNLSSNKKTFKNLGKTDKKASGGWWIVIDKGHGTDDDDHE